MSPSSGGPAGTAMREAVFMSEVTAAITHDVQNVLAIIQQSAGLMSDLLDLSRKESLKSLGLRKGFPYHDKFKTLIGAINEQVDRGTGLSEGLNRLAHAVDARPGPTDAAGLAKLLFSLIGRIARKRRIAFALEASGPVPVDCPPMVVLMGMYFVARALIDALSNCAVRVCVEMREADPVAVFLFPEGGEGGAPVGLPAQMVLGEGAGSIRLDSRDDRITMVFPSCPSCGRGG